MKAIKKIRNAILTLALGAMATTAAFAQHDHSDAPHEGKVEEAGDYHIEVLQKDNTIYFYLLDGDAKALSNKSVTGTVLFQFKDGKTKTITLTAFGTDGFLANDANAINFSKAIVTFKVKGKTASATFSAKKEDGHNHGEGEHHHHDH
ncbi:MAG: hypothetical protein ACKVQB_02015 [Bacteroidia bacterium]